MLPKPVNKEAGKRQYLDDPYGVYTPTPEKEKISFEDLEDVPIKEHTNVESHLGGGSRRGGRRGEGYMGSGRRGGRGNNGHGEYQRGGRGGKS